MAAELEPAEPGGELVSLDAARRAIAAAVVNRDTAALTELRRQAASYQVYYAHREAGRDLANDAGEVKVRAERGLGQIDTEANAWGGPRPPHGQVHPPLNLPDVNPNTRAGWRKLAKLPEEKFERLLADARDDQDAGVSTARILGRRPMVANNSGVSEWYTRAEVIAAAVEVLGAIDLDPASTAEANETVGAARFYTAADNGLERPWAGRVFLNPPYSLHEVAGFTLRLVGEYTAGNVTAAIVLTNNSTDTMWWQTLAAAASAECWPLGRDLFWHPDRPSAPLQGQSILYLGPYPGQFAETFAAFGLTRRWAG